MYKYNPIFDVHSDTVEKYTVGQRFKTVNFSEQTEKIKTLELDIYRDIGLIIHKDTL